jgi:hypothetical protein
MGEAAPQRRRDAGRRHASFRELKGLGVDDWCALFRIDRHDVHEYHRVQINHFFEVQDGSRTPSGLRLKLVSHLHRMRTRFGHPIALKALDQKHGQIVSQTAGLPRELVDMIQAPACAV